MLNQRYPSAWLFAFVFTHLHTKKMQLMYEGLLAKVADSVPGLTFTTQPSNTKKTIKQKIETIIITTILSSINLNNTSFIELSKLV